MSMNSIGIEESVGLMAKRSFDFVTNPERAPGAEFAVELKDLFAHGRASDEKAGFADTLLSISRWAAALSLRARVGQKAG
jgi:hypothetical protein